MILDKIRNKFKSHKLLNLLKKLKKFGDLNDISVDTQIVYPERVEIGSYIYIGPGARINGLGGLEIKSGTIIGPNLILHSANHKFKQSRFIPYDETFDFRKVTIGENVWVGGNVIIVPGTEIGEGCIIGAGSVVSGKIAPLSIVVGNPCRVIKTRDAEHYYKLKKENKIYLKNKKENKITPNLNIGYNE